MKLAANFMLVLATFTACSAQVVDRMVAVVNRQVILQSELEQTAHVECLLQGKPLDELTAAEMQAVLDRMIDQALLQQQIVNTAIMDPAPQEISSHLREARAQIPGAATDDQWRGLLNSYGVTQQDVENQIAAQLRILRFIDLRFRTLARVDRAAISNYYTEKLLPELRKQGAPEPPLEQVSGKIEKILTEQRIDELLSSWLQTLRSQARIQKLNAAARPVAGVAQ
ncbi:MAG TPA: SurA N-terminal domain-containing protein [Candidatus Angelobacter sp.]